MILGLELGIAIIVAIIGGCLELKDVFKAAREGKFARKPDKITDYDVL